MCNLASLRLGQRFGSLAHLGGALQFVPVEGFAVDGALESLEQNNREQLAVGKSLQPYVPEQPAVSLVGGMPAFQAEGHRRSDEIDQQEAEKVDQKLVKVGGRGGEWMVITVNEKVDNAGQEHQVDKG